MKILVKRTGGYAGLSSETKMDTMDESKMNRPQANSIEQTVESIGFFDLPSSISAQTVGADLEHYEITVIDGERRHTISFIDDGSNNALPLRKLMNNLNIQ